MITMNPNHIETKAIKVIAILLVLEISLAESCVSRGVKGGPLPWTPGTADIYLTELTMSTGLLPSQADASA
jgi:hypothetical protein